MKRLALIFALAVTALPLVADTEAYHYGVGPVKLENKDLRQLSHNGPVSLKDVVVQDALNVNGTVIAEKSSFNMVNVNGRVELNDVVVRGAIRIHGVLEADKSVFQKPLSVAGNKIVLSDCVTVDIDMDGDNSVIHLKDGTVVSGNIEFSEGHGKIFKDEQSIISGHVTGGTIEKVKGN